MIRLNSYQAESGLMPDNTGLRIRTVLFATDLSDGSSIVLNWAAAIASTYKAKLALVHVFDPGNAGNWTDSSSSDLRNLANVAKTELERVGQSLLAAQGITSEIIVRYGNVRDAIFQVQHELSAEMVVLGSSGKKTHQPKFLGSIAEAILREMRCGVVTVGPRVSQRPFSSNPQIILFPTDFSASSLAALPAAISLALDLCADLALLHVCNPYESHSCFEHQATCRKNLAAIAEQVGKQRIPVEQFLESGVIAERCLYLAKEKTADFIVMGVRHGDLEDGTRLHGTVADLIREAPCPIFTLAHQANAGLSKPLLHC